MEYSQTICVQRGPNTNESLLLTEPPAVSAEKTAVPAPATRVYQAQLALSYQYKRTDGSGVHQWDAYMSLSGKLRDTS